MAAIGASWARERNPADPAKKMGMSFNKMPSAMRRSRLLLSACAARSPRAAAPPRGGRGGPRVVATTTQLADMARNVAPGAHVTALLTPNTDPHEYEVRPRDVKALAQADVVLRSGGEADEWLDGALDGAGVDDARRGRRGRRRRDRGRRPALVAGPAPRRAGGDRDRRGAIPGADAAARTCAAARARRGGRALHRRRAGRAAPARHEPRRARVLRAPLRDRGRRHGHPVAARPRRSRRRARSRSSWTTIRAAGVTAIFAESSVNPKVEQAIAARGRRARRAASCGRTRSARRARDGATYIGSIEANTRALVEGFTGPSRELPLRCLTSPPPTSSAGSSRSCCWP